MWSRCSLANSNTLSVVCWLGTRLIQASSNRPSNQTDASHFTWMLYGGHHKPHYPYSQEIWVNIERMIFILLAHVSRICRLLETKNSLLYVRNQGKRDEGQAEAVPEGSPRCLSSCACFPLERCHPQP